MKKIMIIVLLVALFSSCLIAAASNEQLTSAPHFFEKFDAFLEANVEAPAANLYDRTAVLDSNILVIGSGWTMTIYCDESERILRVKGSVPVSDEHIAFYNAVIFGLSQYEKDALLFYPFTPEAKKAAAINLWVNGYERFMTFDEGKGHSEMYFDFKSDVKRSTQFLSVGNHIVGEEYLQAGEYTATARDKDSSLRIYRNRKLVYSSMLNKNADTEKIVLFDGDVIEVKLNTAIMRLVMQ